LGSWLISAWLEMPHALKTFLENQFLFYKAGPSNIRFTKQGRVHSRLFTYLDFASKDRPIRNFTTAVASPERRMTMNKRIRVPQNTSFNHVGQLDKSHKPCFASLSVMHTGV
jgi:hypothetical protein